jgi:hypothetical protein
MVKFVPVSDVERPRAAQNLHASANDKHRKFDNPHTVGKTVDRGWQQGNVGWGVLGAFGNSDKDDAAQVIKHAEGAHKMMKNDKGLWVKVKNVSSDKSEIPSSSRGRGGGISVLGSLKTLENASQRKNHIEDEGSKDSYRGRSDSRFRDDSEDNDRDYKHERDKRKRSRSTSRGRRESSRRESRRRESRERSRDRSTKQVDSDHRSHKSSKSRRESRHDRDKSSSRSRSRSNSPLFSHRDRPDLRREKSRIERRDRSRSPHQSNRGHTDRPSSHRNGDSSRSIQNLSVSVTDRGILKERGIRNAPSDHDHPSDNSDENIVFQFSATQVANRFLEIYSGIGLEISKARKSGMKKDADNEIDELTNVNLSEKRLDLIACLFVDSAAVLSLRNGKVMLASKSAIRESFARTSPEDCRCSYRIVVDIPENSNRTNIDGSSAVELHPPDVEGRLAVPEDISYCLDFHAPNSSPGLGDRSKDTALLYRCVGSLLTHIWGAVDPEKLSSVTASSDTDPSSRSRARDIFMKSKCWAWASAMIQLDYPSFPELSQNEGVVIFHDYNTVEVWG